MIGKIITPFFLRLEIRLLLKCNPAVGAATAPGLAATKLLLFGLGESVASFQVSPPNRLLARSGAIPMLVGGGLTGAYQPIDTVASAHVRLLSRLMEGEAAAAKAPNTATPYRTSGATPCRGSPPPATPVPYAKVPPPPAALDVLRAQVYDASWAQL